MKLSVVIPCLNAASTLGEQLDALARQKWPHPWEVILADNGSRDGSPELARRYGDKIMNLRVVDASQRRGQPFALNTGAHAAAGESIAFTDADDEVGEGWLAAMGDALVHHEFVACRMDTEKFNPPWNRDNPQKDNVQKIWYPPWLPHAGGGTLGVRKTLFEAVGDFDERLPYLHDTDFCFRAQLRGAKLQFVPDAVLHLRRRDSLKSHYRQSRNYAEYNVILAKRYWPPEEHSGFFWKIFLRDCVQVVRNLPKIRSPFGKYRIAWDFGRQVGRLIGVMKHGGVPV